jgi:predicted outer membrane repeat protein
MALDSIYDFDVTIITCTFTENSAAESGGAIYNDSGDDKITIAHCYFETNDAASGGAVCDYGYISKISSCVFTQNTALENGGALERIYGNIENCIIKENIAGDFGGGLAGCKGTISNCVIENNSAGGDYISGYGCIGGGGLVACSGTIENCSITGNTALYDGGLSFCNGTIINCEISGNTADEGGGLGHCDATVIKCIIKGNSSRYGGGLFECEGVITSCIIADNTATYSGGGLYLFIGTINNCLIVRNSSDYMGGGLYNCGNTIRNCTIARNKAVYGGGLYGCGGTITNCIISGNSSQIDSCSIPTYSCIKNWTGGGEGNIDESPLFVDAGTGDYHLRTDSPCINAGDPNFIPEDDETDIDGQNRVMGSRVDMGADEVLTDDKLITVALDGSGDYLKIQDAIDGALEGDKIIVAKGTYFENIIFDGKEITLTSTNPDDWDVVSETIIDGGGIDSVVTFDGTESSECVLTGFTITGGYTDYSDGGGLGGGICAYGYQPVPTITKCIITNNEATGEWLFDGAAGGIYNCDGIISDCIITDNIAGDGGGLARCDGKITNCTITGNSAGFSGGGLYNCNAQIQNCVISNNTSGEYLSDTSGGGGLFYCNGLISNCIIKGNYTGCDGGGLGYCEAIIENCQITNNSALQGGGLYMCWGSINNCTVAGNTSYNIAGTGGGLYGANEPITNCIFWSNEPEDIAGSPYSTIDPIISYCNIEDGWDAGGNISVDPNFVDQAGGDYHLRWKSPCIDAGFIIGTNTFDIDNEPRVMGSRVDMGADEVGPKQADFTRDGIINTDDFSVLGNSWQTTPVDENWYILSDLWEDGVIGIDDLAVFIEDWLWEADWHE